jgi:hypothetical protein
MYIKDIFPVLNFIFTKEVTYKMIKKVLALTVGLLLIGYATMCERKY